MANKLLQALGSNNSFGEILASVRSQGPSNAMFNKLYTTNPQFKAFADNMRGKSPEDAFRENGLDFNNFRNQRW